jgi:hypothetical protein
MAKGIGVDEWMSELAMLTARQSAVGFTTEDVAETTAHSLAWVRGRVRKWIKQGLVEYAGERESMRSDNRPCTVPVYRLVKKEKKK